MKYVGFDIPNEFVVGYGLDYAEQYRNLRVVGTLAPHVYAWRATVSSRTGRARSPGAGGTPAALGSLSSTIRRSPPAVVPSW